MKLINAFIMLTAMLTSGNALASDASSMSGKQDPTEYFGQQDIQINGGRLTPEALWAMGRIGDFDVSPDGKRIAYTVAYYSISQNKSNREVFVINADGSNKRQITHTKYQENEVKWIKGGTKIAFLSNDDGSSQLYEMNPDGTGREKLSSYPNDIEGYAFSPTGKKFFLSPK
jgi:Tol biopolymer transport system component